MLRQKYSKKKRREKFKNKTKKKYSGGGEGDRTRPNTGRRAREKRKKEEAVMKQNEEILERLNREAGIATSRQNEETMQKLLEDSSSSSQTSASLTPTSSLVEEMDALLEPIQCRRGDNSKDCDGKDGAKKKKVERKKCKSKGGKVVNKNSKNEACELKMRPIGVNCPPGSERDKHCEKVFGSELPCRSTEDPRNCLAQPDRVTESGITSSTLMSYNNREGELDRYKIDERRQKPPPIDGYSKENRGTMPMKGPEAIASQPLPEGWSEEFDSVSMRKYYVNNLSGTSQWEKPTTPAVSESSDISSSGSVQAAVAQLESRGASKDEQPVSTGLTANSQCALMKKGEMRYAAEVHDEDGDGEVEYTGRSAAAPSDPMCNKPPPSGWDQATDEAMDKIYYYNSTTGEKSWTYPEQSTLPASKVQETVAQLESRGASKDEQPVSTGLTANSQCALMKKGEMRYAAEVHDEDGDGEVEYTGRSAAAPSDPMCNKPPPSGWDQATDEAMDKIYYYNSTTGEKSWTYPEQSTLPASKVQETVAQLENRDNNEEAAVAKKLTPNSQCAIVKKGTISYAAEVEEGEKGELEYTGQVASSASSDLCNKELPEGWSQSMDENTQKIYYYNSTTGERSWTFPQSSGSSKPTASNSANPTSPNAGPVAAAAAAVPAPAVSSTHKKSKKQIIFELNYEKTFQHVLQNLRP